MTSPNKAFDTLSQEFLTAWQDAHGFGAGNASILMGAERFAILIESVFSQAERKLAEDQTGETLLREYVTELLHQISVPMVPRIEQVAGRRVLSIDVNVNLDSDQVMFIYKLEDRNAVPKNS